MADAVRRNRLRASPQTLLFWRALHALDSTAQQMGDEFDLVAELRGEIAVRHVVVTLGDKAVLKDVSLLARAGSRTAVIGPTAAGKTQLLYAMTGLIRPTIGTIPRSRYACGKSGDVDRAVVLPYLCGHPGASMHVGCEPSLLSW